MKNLHAKSQGRCRIGYVATSCLLFLLLAGCGTNSSMPVEIYHPACYVPGDPDITADEYEIISIAILHHFQYYELQEIVLDQGSETRFAEALKYINILYESIDGDKSSIEYLDIASFDLNEADKALRHTFKFGSHFKLSVPYTVVTRDELADIFKHDDYGWDRFYDRFPGASGLIMVSRVIFNDDQTKALLLVGSQSHYLVGRGGWVLLVKRDGEWVVVGDNDFWVS